MLFITYIKINHAWMLMYISGSELRPEAEAQIVGPNVHTYVVLKYTVPVN
jgi:hypothetical protein